MSYLNLPPDFRADFQKLLARIDSLERRRLPLFPDLSVRPVLGGVAVEYGIFGDGSDAAVTFDGSATVLGLAPSSGVYTLTRDLYLLDGSVITGAATINGGGYRIFCAGGLTNNGLMHNNGFTPVGFAAGVGGGNNGTLGGGTILDGHAGGGFTGGGAASALSSALGGSGGAGGASTGGGTGGGTAGAVATKPADNVGGYPRNIWTALACGTIDGSNSKFNGGCGGSQGSGEGGGPAAAGAGGGGGGILAIYALTLINNGTISCNGGNGGNASGGTGANSAGGGGGGAGGGLIIVCGQTSTVGTTSVTGGVGGSPTGTHSSGGRNGATGSAGNLFLLKG